MRSILLILASLLIVACGDRRSKMSVGPERARGFDAVTVSDKSPVAVPVQDRKLIKDGSLTFESPDLKKTQAELAAISTRLRGYTSNETLSNNHGRTSCQIVIRVPAENFEDLVAEVEKLGVIITGKDIRTRDVTEEYFDVDTRINTKKNVEARYRELLEQAHTVEEMLAIEREIGNVRSEIEVMEGKLNYLKNQVSFSTLEVNYYKETGSGFNFPARFVQSLSNGWNNLLAFFIGLMNIWPFLILFSFALWGLRKWLRKRDTHKSASNTGI